MDAPDATCPVVRQLAAYNARDIDAFAACFAADVTVLGYPDTARSQGREALYAAYAEYFASHPDLHCELVHRTRLRSDDGEVVFDEELVQRVAGQPRIHAMAIYTVRNQEIVDVRFVMGGTRA